MSEIEKTFVEESERETFETETLETIRGEEMILKELDKTNESFERTESERDELARVDVERTESERDDVETVSDECQLEAPVCAEALTETLETDVLTETSEQTPYNYENDSEISEIRTREVQQSKTIFSELIRGLDSEFAKKILKTFIEQKFTIKDVYQVLSLIFLFIILKTLPVIILLMAVATTNLELVPKLVVGGFFLLLYVIL